MGLLDDAIREHLDLKRRRGADPTEIEREEREALGPVKRAFAGDSEMPESAESAEIGEDSHEAVGAPDDGGVEDLHVPADSGLDDHHDGRVESDTTAHDLADAPTDHGAEPPGANVPSATDLDAQTVSGDATPAPPPAPQPIAGDPRRHPPIDAPAGQTPPLGDTVEFDVERSLRDEDAEEHADVLEETPEFLQDAPDHDRLWFEQRPPRDFDFDG
jgi:hypothetical protein